MAGRLTIGLRYRRKEQWVGGIYYVQNLVRALGLLPPARRPRLVIVGEDPQALAELSQTTGYPDLRQISRGRIRRAPARSWPLTLWGHADEIDLLLLGSAPGLEDRAVPWFPDFQEHRFPAFFPPEEIADRLARNTGKLTGCRHALVSSRDVAEDLRRWYGGLGAQAHVAPFTSFLDAEAERADPVVLRRTYGLPERYFLCSNQLWKHKNHQVILDALDELGIDAAAAPIVFTGLEEDYRDPAYVPALRARAAASGADRRIRYLGFLPRADQLGLMKGAIAVIQPSLCEGWSTVVEDAKALGVQVLASDIAVHREQLDRNVDFFAPHDHHALAALLRRYTKADPEVRPLDYPAARRRFGVGLLRTLTDIADDFRRRRVDRFIIAPEAHRD